jgi:hypothetical protein
LGKRKRKEKCDENLAVKVALFYDLFWYGSSFKKCGLNAGRDREPKIFLPRNRSALLLFAAVCCRAEPSGVC